MQYNVSLTELQTYIRTVTSSETYIETTGSSNMAAQTGSTYISDSMTHISSKFKRYTCRVLRLFYEMHGELEYCTGKNSDSDRLPEIATNDHRNPGSALGMFDVFGRTGPPILGAAFLDAKKIIYKLRWPI